MNETYSVEIDKYSATALGHVLKKLEDSIPDFEYDWRIYVNAGGIDYGIYLNINVDKKEITICNQPKYGGDGDDDLDEILAMFEKDEDD